MAFYRRTLRRRSRSGRKRFRRSLKLRYKKRRVNRKKSKMSSRMKNYLYTQKKLNGVKKYIGEKRLEGLENQQNKILWAASLNHCINDYSWCKLVLDAKLGQNATEFSGLAAPLGVAENSTKNWFMYKQAIMTNIRNVSQHPCFIKIMEVVAKNDRNYTIPGLDTGAKICINDMYEGALTEMDTGSISNTLAAGEGIFDTYTVGTGILRTYSLMWRPKSYQFKMNWKITKSSMYKLDAGDDIIYPVYGKNVMFRNQQWFNPDKSQVKVVKKGLTKVLLFKIYGALGRDDNVNNSVVGIMNAQIVFTTQHRSFVIPVQKGQNEQSISCTYDDLTTVPVVLEGPAEKAVVNEDP